MKDSYITRFLDSLIVNESDIPVEERFKLRSLVLLCLAINGLAFVLVSVQVLGHYKDESVFAMLSLGLIGQLLLKFSRNYDLTVVLFILSGTGIMLYNVTTTGDIYSYNHKWFVPIMLLVNATFSRWTLPYLLFAIAVQCYFWMVSPKWHAESIGTATDHLVDNIALLVLVFCFLWIYRKYADMQWDRIKGQRQTLESQKLALIESNDLLQRRTEELQESNQELERFAYIASHDLKTPLNNIISFSTLLEPQLKKLKNPEIDLYFGFIRDGSHRMNHLIKDVLEYSRLSAEVESVEALDLNATVAEINDSISQYLHDRKAVVEIQGKLPTIFANRTRIYLLFKNLIENGIKYNQSERPEVVISCQELNSQFELCFEDNGIGMEQEYLDRIFTMFTRLHTNEEYDGTGLGLSLSRKIVENIGGSISVKSEPGKGSKFCIFLPLTLIEEDSEKQASLPV